MTRQYRDCDAEHGIESGTDRQLAASRSIGAAGQSRKDRDQLDRSRQRQQQDKQDGKGKLCLGIHLGLPDMFLWAT